MKNIIISLSILVSVMAYAQNDDSSSRWGLLNPGTLTSLEEGVLQDAHVDDIMKGRSIELEEIASDLKIYHQKTLEGIPSPKHDPVVQIEGAYRAVDLIKEVLSESMEYELLGGRVPFMLERLPEIVHSSGARTDEMLLRFTLNRCQDLIGHLIPVSGYNYDEIARWSSSFIKKHLELAAGYGNNRYVVTSIFNHEKPSPSFQVIHTAEFGRMYAQLLWKYSTGLSSDTTKAILLMKLLSFLGWDLNNDLRRREEHIAQSIRDVYRAQHSPEYKRVLERLRLGYEPRGKILASLRSKVERVLSNLNERLGPSSQQSSEGKNGR